MRGSIIYGFLFFKRNIFLKLIKRYPSLHGHQKAPRSQNVDNLSTNEFKMCGCNFLSNKWEKVLLAKPILQFYWTRTCKIYSKAQITWSSVQGDSKVLQRERKMGKIYLAVSLSPSSLRETCSDSGCSFPPGGKITKQC